MQILKDINFLIGRNRKILTYVIVLILSMEGIRLLSNTLYGRLIDELVTTMVISSTLMYAWAFSSSFSWVLDAINDYLIIKLIVQIEHDIPEKSMRHLLGLSMGSFNRLGTGRLTKRIQKGTDSLSSLIGTFSWELLSATIQYVSTTVYLAYLYVWWGVILVVAAPIFIALTVILNNLKAPLRKERHELYEEEGRLLVQVIEDIRQIMAHAKQEYELRNYKGVLDIIVVRTMKEFRIEYIFNFLRGNIITAAILGVFWVGALAVQNEVIKVGDLVAAVGLATAATLSLFRLTRILIKFFDNYEAISRLITFLMIEPEIVDGPDAQEVTNLQGSIEFRNVTFNWTRYDNPRTRDTATEYTQGKPLTEAIKIKRARLEGKSYKGLDEVSLKIKPGQTVALVGPSGSGKSTLASLLLRFFDPHKGSILVGGIPLKDIKLASYRKHIAYVSQEGGLSDRTVREIIAGGTEFFENDVLIWKAIERAHATEFVCDLPKGLDTRVGPKGVKLSGGQKQRLSIARALFRKPVILVLDEATSALDTKSEAAVQSAMHDLQERGDTTIVVIAHRLSTIMHADKIVVMSNGKIVETGTHQELIDLGGVYSEMISAQSL